MPSVVHSPTSTALLRALYPALHPHFRYPYAFRLRLASTLPDSGTPNRRCKAEVLDSGTTPLWLPRTKVRLPPRRAHRHRTQTVASAIAPHATAQGIPPLLDRSLA